MRSEKMKVRVIVEKTDTGYSAFTHDYPVFTTGNTVSELLNNVVEALNLYFEDDGIEIGPGNIKLEIDLKQFFQYYRVINAKFLAERIGMNPTLLSQYVKGRKIPSDKQAKKILFGVQEIGRELSEINLVIND